MSLSVHTFNLLVDENKTRQLQQVLTEDELQRAHRFRFEEHCRRFTVARANLRFTLAEYTGLKAKDIQLGKTEHGKPFIVSQQNPAKVSFNLSHSHELAIVIVCRETDIGVDLEHLDTNRPFMDLARRYFNDNEVEYLRSVPAVAFHKAFYKIWTLKESWLKATGLGIMGLSLVGTAMNDQGEMEITDWGGDNPRVGAMGKPSETRHFEPVPGYVAAYTRLYSSQTVSTR